MKKKPTYAQLASRNATQARMIEGKCSEVELLRSEVELLRSELRTAATRASEDVFRISKFKADLASANESLRIAHFDTQTAERRAEELHEHLTTALSACKAWQMLYEHMRDRK